MTTEIKEKKPRRSRAKVKLVSKESPVVEAEKHQEEYDGKALIETAKQRVVDDVKSLNEAATLLSEKDLEQLRKSEEQKIFDDLVEEIKKEKQRRNN